jgi:DNA-binding MarR family transcriptional regulator
MRMAGYPAAAGRRRRDGGRAIAGPVRQRRPAATLTRQLRNVQFISVGKDLDAAEVAAAAFVSVSLLSRRLRRVPVAGGLTMPERSALALLDRCGPSTQGALARRDQVSPQGIGVTLAGLESRGLVARSPDPADGRRVVVSLTGEGQRVLRDKRSAQIEQLARALSAGFTGQELRDIMAAAPLLERLAQRL